MTRPAACIAVLAGLVLVSCADNHRDTESGMDSDAVRQYLKVLSGKRIFFGHQSVGYDVMRGVRELAGEEGTMRFLDAGTPQMPAGGWFADARIGRNGHPAEKCDAFAEMAGRLAHDSLDFALMKFCYADIGPDSDPREVFDLYARTIDSLRRTFPGTKFIPATVPYTLITPRWKRMLKGLLGRSDRSLAANLRRSEFNALVARTYGGGPLFDIARAESTHGDGTRECRVTDGDTVYSLIGRYTSDGGHLSPIGRQRAAVEILRALAEAAAHE